MGAKGQDASEQVPMKKERRVEEDIAHQLRPTVSILSFTSSYVSSILGNHDFMDG